MKLLNEVARGFEFEYAVTAQSMTQRQTVHCCLEALHRLGYTADIGWSLDDETGNGGYEATLAAAWTLSRPLRPVAYNGMRLYEDAMHLEVATPLYASPVDAVRYSLAGEYLVRQAVDELPSGTARLGVRPYKNNVSTQPRAKGYEAVAYGTHSNTALRRRTSTELQWPRVVRELGALFIARLPLIGAGDFVPVIGEGRSTKIACLEGLVIGNRLEYAISPRAAFVTRISGRDTMAERGLVNLRDEPLADTRSWWRYHDIHHESLRCPFQMYVSDVLTAFAFAAFERGLFLDAPRLKDPLRAMRDVSLDSDRCDWLVELTNGTLVDVVRDILQGYYLGVIRELVASEGDERDELAYQTLEWTVEQLADRNLSELAWGIDWVTKRQLLADYEAAGDRGLLVCNQYAFVDGQIRQYVEAGTLAGEQESLFDLHLALEFTASHLTEGVDLSASSISDALSRPPFGTRESLRAHLIRVHEKEIVAANWEKLYFSDGSFLTLPDPTQALCFVSEGTDNLAQHAAAAVVGADRIGEDRGYESVS